MPHKKYILYNITLFIDELLNEKEINPKEIKIIPKKNEIINLVKIDIIQENINCYKGLPCLHKDGQWLISETLINDFLNAFRLKNNSIEYYKHFLEEVKVSEKDYLYLLDSHNL